MSSKHSFCGKLESNLIYLHEPFNRCAGEIYDIAYHTNDFAGSGSSDEAVLISFYGNLGQATQLLLKEQGSVDKQNRYKL